MNGSTQLKVLWSEGLLMAPQHLQQSDRYHETLVTERLSALHAYPWGAVRVELDRRAITDGMIKLDHFAGVLPDGTVLTIERDSLEAPPARPVEGLPPERSVLDVYIGVPSECESAGPSGSRSRYSAHVRRIADHTTEGGEPAEVELAKRNVRLVFGHESRDDMELIKIAEVRRDSRTLYVVDDSFIPPCLRIGASPVLLARLERLLALMHTRRQALIAARRERDQETIEADASDITRFMLLHDLNRALPMLTHLRKSGDLSPRELYRQLLDLFGAVATFSIEASIDVPDFDHLDLRATFEPLFDRLEALLGSTQRESCLIVELEGRGDGMHLAQIDDRIVKCDRFLLAVHTSVLARDAASLVPSIGKVASWQQVTQVVNAAMPGAKLEIAHRPPPEVPVKTGEIYFSIDARGPYWQEITRERAIAVFLPRPFEAQRTRVSLLALPPRRSARAEAQSSMTSGS